MRTPSRLLIAVAATASAFGLYSRVESQWFVLGWVGLVPWLAELDNLDSLRGAALAGWLMSMAFVLAVFSWFGAAIQTYTEAPWPLALLILLLVAPLLQPQFIVFALARHLAGRLGGSGWRVTFTGAAAYVGTEWALGKLFSDTIGHGFYAAPTMRQAADIAGAAGLTFVLVVANECALAVLRAVLARRSRVRRLRTAAAPAAVIVALVVGLLDYGSVREQQLAAVASLPPVRVGIVQADISHYGQLAAELGTFDAVRAILTAHFALSSEALEHHPLDLLVWPETVYPTTFGSPKSADGAAFDREIAGFVQHAGVPLVFGAYDAEDGKEFNAAVLLEASSDSKISFDAYRKADLFPFTEYAPRLFDSAAMRRRFPWLGTWTPGPGPQSLALTLTGGRTIRIAPLICYEAVNPTHAIQAVRQGAEMLVTLSNDSWFATGTGPHLHLIVSAFRSLETRRPQVRATNTGISAFITPTGELLDMLDVHRRAALVAAVVPVRGTSTLMLAWGDWFGPTAFVGALVLLALTWLQRPAAAPNRWVA